ncbi:MAG: hypothetical protein NT005_11135 [Spirochaetes bacterium]|nr:hypothetical protein [Spirochaetota bacterium]MCX7039669.1 hypothetical protein [Spirochaetota bacterium]
MKSYKLLLMKDLLPTVERMCGILQCPFAVVDAEPIWQKQNRRSFRIDVPDFHARILDETAALKGVSTEVLLHTWIEQLAEEIAEDPVEGAKTGISAKCAAIADWEVLGYTGSEPAVGDLVKRLARG